MDYRFHFASTLIDCSYVLYPLKQTRKLEPIVDAYIYGADNAHVIVGFVGHMLGLARALEVSLDVMQIVVPRRYPMLKQAVDEGIVEKLELIEAWFRLERKREAARRRRTR